MEDWSPDQGTHREAAAKGRTLRWLDRDLRVLRTTDTSLDLTRATLHDSLSSNDYIWLICQ